MKDRHRNMIQSNNSQSSATNNTISTSNDLTDKQIISSPYNTNNFMAPQIGSIVRCSMCLGNTVEGKVLAYDQQTKMLAISIIKF